MSDQTWREAFRAGLAPLVPTATLEQLALALAANGPSLCQRGTTYPPAIFGLKSQPCQSACLVGWCGWKAHGLVTTEEVAAYFFGTVAHLGQQLGTWAASQLVCWWDRTPREQACAEMLAEVNEVLGERRDAA